MNRPFVIFPASNPQPGPQHLTVVIRHNGRAVRIKCATRGQADDLGKALIGVFLRHLVKPTPTTPSR